MVKKRAETTKKTADTVTVPADPFAEMVETPPPPTVIAEAIKAEAREVKKAPKRVVRKVSPAAIEVAADAFAEIVTETSPVKNRAKTSVPGAVATGELSEPGAAATGAVKKTRKKTTTKADLDVTAELATAEPEVKLSPVFKALADVSLPEIERDNRARLLMQSPTKLYFYWSVRENPWHQLRAVFGSDLGSYTLVVKLADLKHGSEEIHPAEAEGNWWFDVEPDGEYQAEIGFYAVNRPYFRVIYSNTVTTPRRSPSPHPASDAQWTVSANKFAEVLDVAGFSRDAFDVAMAGDDVFQAENITHNAFAGFIGSGEYEFSSISAEDIRYAMIAIASGSTLEELRWRVSPELFAILQANADKMVAGKAMSALTEHFDIDEAEFTEERLGAAVYGASLVHFPKTLKTRTLLAKYAPVGSHSFR